MMKKIYKLGVLVILMSSFVLGCSKQEDKKETQEASVDIQVTQEPEEVKQEETEKEQKKELKVEIPNEQELLADYTSVEGLHLEAGSRIAVVVKNTETGYWKAVSQGMNQAIEDLNLTLGYEGNDRITLTFEGTKSEAEIGDQVNILDAVLAENPTVVCLSAIDMDSCTAQLEMAWENGIPVIILDSGVHTRKDLVYTTCMTDNYRAGRDAAIHLCEQLDDSGQVMIVAHAQTTETSQKRVKGFENEIKENHPEVEIVYVVNEPMTESEASIEEQIKAAMVLYPEIKGVFSTNEIVSKKVVSVFSKYEDKQVQLVGFDLGKTQMEAIRSGKEVGVIAQNPYGMGYATIVAAARSALGLENDPLIDSGYQWIDKDTIDLEENEKYLYE